MTRPDHADHPDRLDLAPAEPVSSELLRRRARSSGCGGHRSAGADGSDPRNGAPVPAGDAPPVVPPRGEDPR